MRRFMLMMLIMLCAFGLGSAQENTEYPTIDALAALEMPERDRVQLARELLGVTDIPAPPQTPIAYAVGDLRTFSVNDNESNSTISVEAELYALGEHIAIWVDSRVNGSRERAANLAREFDTVIYPKTRALWGSERTPGIDNDPRVVALFSYNISQGTAAYYASEHSLPRVVAPSSNEAEMMMYNLAVYGTNFDSPEVFSVTAHEFQHMIRDNINASPTTWLNEGMSVFNEWVMDYTSTGLTFAENLFYPHTQLNSWNSTGANYGTAGLFITYFYQRYGLNGISALSHATGLSMGLVDTALDQIEAAEDANTLYADFAAATWLQDTSTDMRWGYPNVVLFEPASRTVSGKFPAEFNRKSQPYATEYVKLPDAPRGEVLKVTAEFNATAKLIPTDAPSGTHFWLSVREDNSMTSLTRAFDLRNVTSAALNYKIWHFLEEDYDFGYVMVSENGGETWDVVSPPSLRTRSLYGKGYTNVSNDWVEERLPLHRYIGREILVRFMVITDDALTRSGLAIDDIRLDEVGYASDFEVDDGGWEARGWVRTDNRLPAQIWLQVLQERVHGVDVQRILAHNGETLEAFIHDDATHVTLAISPIIPVTNEMLDYTVTLDIDGE